MKIPQEVLPNLAQYGVGATPELGDGEATIPPLFSPVLELRGAAIHVSIGAVLRDFSHMCHFNRRCANAGGFTDIITQLAKGLWEISLWAAYTSNYDSGDAGPNALVEFRNIPHVQEWRMVGFHSMSSTSALSIQSTSRTIKILIRDRLEITQQMTVNGVGQDHRFFVSYVFNRLL